MLHALQIRSLCVVPVSSPAVRPSRILLPALALTVMVVAVLQTQDGYPLWSSILVSVGAGLVVGAINGFIIVKLRVSSFICPLGTATVIGAVQQIITGGNQPYPPTSTAWSGPARCSLRCAPWA